MFKIYLDHFLKETSGHEVAPFSDSLNEIQGIIFFNVPLGRDVLAHRLHPEGVKKIVEDISVFKLLLIH